MPGGRPTKYKKQYVDQAYKMCLLMKADDEKLAQVFDVHPDTIAEWKNVHPEFSEAIREGKEGADARVAQSLYDRATGYSHPETVVTSHKGKTTKTTVTKHYPPDTAAAIIWLKNRQKQHWRDRVDHDVSGTIRYEKVERVIVDMPPEGPVIEGESHVVSARPMGREEPEE